MSDYQFKVELLSYTPNGEELIEQAARVCHDSKNLAGKPLGHLIRHVIKMGHLSCLEHAKATFKISGISRACSHQLVRYRICTFSQKSQRYVDEKQFDSVIPPSIQGNHLALETFEGIMSAIQLAYSRLRTIGIPKEDARFVLPNACQTELVLTTNAAELRHIFSQRCDRHAQWEIRAVCEEMLRQLMVIWPHVFEDQKRLLPEGQEAIQKEQ